MFSNGSASAGLTINLTGTVADDDVFVLAQASASAAILAVADQTNGAGWFNGNDAVVLRRGTTVIDVIGQIGNDPGTQWGTGLTSTQDNTLRRKAAVTDGDPIGSDVFDPAVQWDGFATDTFDGLGSHTAGPPPADAAPTVASTTPANGSIDVGTERERRHHVQRGRLGRERDVLDLVHVERDAPVRALRRNDDLRARSRHRLRGG